MCFQSADEELQSTSAMFTMSTFSTAGYRNPTFRVMYLDPVTYTPLEWDQYFIDINAVVGKLQFNSCGIFQHDVTIVMTESFSCFVYACLQDHI